MKKLVYIINIDWYFALHWLERAKASTENGYDVYVIMKCSSESATESISSAGVKIIDANITRKGMNPFVELSTIRSIYKIINQIKPDLVHTITVKSNLYGALACMMQKIPFVCSVTGMGYAFSNTKLKAKVIKIFIKNFYKLISYSKNYLILFENNDDLEYMVRKNIIPKKNVKRISGSGVDCDLFDYYPEPSVKTIKILCAARMLYDKGIPLIIDAAKELNSDSIDFEIQIAGILDEGNPGAIPEQQLIQWQEQGLITWLGQIDDMPNLFKHIQIALLPTSYGEGIPRFIIEAAASGRPVITTDVAGCREIVEHKKNGFLIGVNNKSQLVDALKCLILSKTVREKMGRAGRQKVLDEYSQEKVISQTLGVYETVLQN